MRIPVEQAAADALAAWIASQLPDCVVKPEWAGPNTTLANRTITIVQIGDRIDEQHDVALLSSTPVSNGRTTGEWRYANASQKFQIDVWCSTLADRHDVCAQLDDALNAGTMPLGIPTADPAGGGLLVPLGGDYAGGTAGFLFDATTREDDPTTNSSAEYRATKRGTAWFALTRKATGPALQKAGLAMRTGAFPGGLPPPDPTPGAMPPAGNAYGTAAVTDGVPPPDTEISGI